MIEKIETENSEFDENDKIKYILNSPSEYLNYLNQIFPFNYEIFNNALMTQKRSLEMYLSQKSDEFTVEYVLKDVNRLYNLIK